MSTHDLIEGEALLDEEENEEEFDEVTGEIKQGAGTAGPYLDSSEEDEDEDEDDEEAARAVSCLPPKLPRRCYDRSCLLTANLSGSRRLHRRRR